MDGIRRLDQGYLMHRSLVPASTYVTLRDLLVCQQGSRPTRIVSHSNYLAPIDSTPLGLIEDGVITQILSQEHSGFSAWWGEPLLPTDESYRLFLARYIDRGPVAESRIDIEDGAVTYVTEKDPTLCEFEPLDFLARLTPHIPKKWESTTRYYGWYSHRQRGERRKRQISDFASTQLEPLERKKASRTWAALIKRVFEVDPLLCPRCGGRMQIRSFITNQHEIVRLLANLGVSPFERPEPIRGRGPPQSELILEPTPESDS